MQDFEEPTGPFSGTGYPGSSIYRNPGIFSGSGSPGSFGTGDITSLIVGVCVRANAVCPTLSQEVCVANFQNQWNKLTTDCARNSLYAYMTCLMSASLTCTSDGNAASESCLPFSTSQCGGTSTSGGTTTGGGTGGSTGGSGGTGGSTGGTGGSTGGTGGSTGGTGGSTGGTSGTGGAAGTGGTGGRGGRDAGRG